ncbi:hypothetical protein [Novipirellula rosea]
MTKSTERALVSDGGAAEIDSAFASVTAIQANKKDHVALQGKRHRDR